MAAAHLVRSGSSRNYFRAHYIKRTDKPRKRRCASWRHRHPALAWLVRPWRGLDIVSRLRPHVCLWCITVAGSCCSLLLAAYMGWPHIVFTILRM